MNDNRTKGAVVTLFIGLALNIALGVSKLVVGLKSDASSVMSDAFNNLSDAAVSVVTIIATFLAMRGADHEHPFGHGRYEYMATFVLGAVIVAVGAEVLTNGIKRAITPEELELGTAVWATLGAAIGVKAFMAVFYTVRGARARSDTLKAAAVDSASDAAVTSVVLCCALAERYTGVHIDGYASIAVAVVILVFAVRILKSTVSRLLGERPDPELYERILQIVSAPPEVISVHDLVINDYGSAHKLAEADAVFSSDMTFTAVHAVCDGIEKRVREQTGVRLCLHADPLVTGDARLDELSARINSVLDAYGASAHDLDIDDDAQTITLDVKIPDGQVPTAELADQVRSCVRGVLPYEVDIGFDYI